MGRIFALFCACLVSWTTAVRAQAAYPDGPVTIVVPFAASGTVDLMGRIAAQALEARLKKPFIVENKVGAGGVIGTSYVARAQPDGRTLLLAPTAFAITPYVYEKLNYDPLRDFRAVGLMGYTANVMVVPPSLGVKTVQEFIDLAKKKEGGLPYASPGVGTPQHLYLEYFAHKAGLHLRHVPYAGSSPALVGIVSGDTSVMFADIAPSVPLIEGGKIQALASLTPTRHPSLPDTPTVADTIPGFTGMGWQGLLAPAGTPDAIIKTLNEALVDYLKTPEAAQKMRSIGVDVKWTTPGEAQDWIAAQLAQFGEIVPMTGIQPAD
jgi:tripartite-type tricarboxylate transporter receptor subunit TctC